MTPIIIEQISLARRIVLLGIIAGVPLFFLRLGTDPFNLPKLSLLILGVVVAASITLIGILQGYPASGLRRLWFPAAVMATPLVASWLTTAYKEWTLLGQFARFQGLLPGLLLAALGILAADGFERYPAQIAWALSVAGAVAGAYALIQFVGLDPFTWALAELRTSQTLSTVGNPNFAGGFLGITLPLAIGLWVTDRGRRKASLRLISLITAGLIVTFSQGGYAAALAGLAVVFGFVLTERWRMARLIGTLAAIAIFAALFIAPLVALIRPGVLPFTVEERGRWWIAAGRMGADAPMTGHGPNTFAVEGVQYRTETDALQQRFDYTDDPHSIPFAVFAGQGFAGVLGLLLLVVWVVHRGFSLESSNVLGAAFLAAVVAYFVQSLVSIDELSLRVGFWGGLAGLAVTSDVQVMHALAVRKEVKVKKKRAERNPGKSQRKKRSRLGKDQLKLSAAVAAVISVLGVSIAGWWSVGLVVADIRARTGLEAIERGDLDHGRLEIQRALAFRDEYRLRHLAAFRFGRLAVDRGIEATALIDEMEQFFSYLNFFPDVPALRDYGNLLHLWQPDDPSINELSLVQYRRAVSLDPFNPLLRAEAATVAVEANQYELVVGIVTPALDLTGNEYPQLKIALAEAETGLGHLEEALQIYRELLEQSPQSADYREAAANVAMDLKRYGDVVELVDPVAGTVDSPTLWGLLAFAEAKLGHEDAARFAIERALTLDPDQRLALRTRRIVDD